MEGHPQIANLNLFATAEQRRLVRLEAYTIDECAVGRFQVLDMDSTAVTVNIHMIARQGVGLEWDDIAN